jgi:hypothetical protein
MKMIMVSDDLCGLGHLDMIHVRCKQWSCPVCSKVNARQWKNHVLTTLAIRLRGLSWVFCTITATGNANKAGAYYTLKNLQQGWNILRGKMRRWNGNETFEYLRIFEKHMDGQFGGYHMHMICAVGEMYGQKKEDFAKVLEREARARKLGLKPRKRLKREKHPTRWLKDAAVGSKLGNQTDFQQIGSNTMRVAGYMIKYIFKQLDILEFPMYQRRIQTSRKFGSPNTRRNKNGRMWRPKSAIFLHDLRKYGTIRDLTMKRLVTEEDFEGGKLWYPAELK